MLTFILTVLGIARADLALLSIPTLRAGQAFLKKQGYMPAPCARLR